MEKETKIKRETKKREVMDGTRDKGGVRVDGKSGYKEHQQVSH